MKYVILKRDKKLLPVIIPDNQNWDFVEIFSEEYIPVAAGACYNKEGGGLLTDKRRNKFNLEPKEKDAEVISAMLNGANDNFYIDFLNEY